MLLCNYEKVANAFSEINSSETKVTTLPVQTLTQLDTKRCLFSVLKCVITVIAFECYRPVFFIDRQACCCILDSCSSQVRFVRRKAIEQALDSKFIIVSKLIFSFSQVL